MSTTHFFVKTTPCFLLTILSPKKIFNRYKIKITYLAQSSNRHNEVNRLKNSIF